MLQVHSGKEFCMVESLFGNTNYIVTDYVHEAFNDIPEKCYL